MSQPPDPAPLSPIVDRRAASAAIEAFLKAIGRNEADLHGTGARVTDMFIDELCMGYGVDTRRLVTDSVIAVPSPVLVVVRDVSVVTMCPHHLLPSMGLATVAFKASGHILGLGTVAALVDAHARRLALQEQIGEGVISDLDAVLTPEWVGCRVVLAHGCMIARGERAIGTRVETLALRGARDAITASEAHAALGLGAGR